MFFPEPEETLEILASHSGKHAMTFHGVLLDDFRCAQGTLSLGIKLLPATDFANQDYTIFIAENDVELNAMMQLDLQRRGIK